MPEPLGEGLEERDLRVVVNAHSYIPPDPTEKVHQCWRDDELFGYQFLNGANPMLLRRSTSLPSRLVLPPGLEALGAQLERELQVLPPTLRGSPWPCGEGPKMSQGKGGCGHPLCLAAESRAGKTYG